VNPVPRPRGARYLLVDGSTLPLELSYAGLDEDGIHVWQVATPIPLGAVVQVDVLPPNCAVAFPVPDE